MTEGLPQPPAAADNAQYTYLERPTPFLANAGVKAGIGPLIRRLRLQIVAQISCSSALNIISVVLSKHYRYQHLLMLFSSRLRDHFT